MKVAIYTRISTSNKGQDAGNQLLVLRDFCNLMNYSIYNEYVDEISGGTADRPEFKKVFENASQRKFDMVLFWSLDRFSREGTRATINYLERLDSFGVVYKSYTEQYIDSCGIFKDVIISLLSTLAKQEKVRIGERVKAGLRRSTKISGRPKLSATTIHKIKELKSNGFSNRAVARQIGLSHSTVALYIKEY